MADDVPGMVEAEPQRWFVVFSEETDARFVRWLAVGRFKHVMAIGYVPAEKVWVFVDPRLKRTVVEAIRDGKKAERRVAEYFRSHEVLKLPASEPARFRLRAGLWCVPTVAALVGVASCALRPDAFYRDCLAAGAERVPMGDEDGPVRPEEDAGSSSRPGDRAGA